MIIFSHIEESDFENSRTLSNGQPWVFNTENATDNKVTRLPQKNDKRQDDKC